MLRALYSAASGMDAMQFQLDTTANNMANASTTAFKRTRVNFEDVFYQVRKLPGMLDSQGQYTPLGVIAGLGTRVNSTQLDFRQGSIIDTGKQLDVAIVGQGFFEVQDGTRSLYTRAGNFAVNADGNLVLASADRGRQPVPPITIPQDATEISISQEGVVSVLQAGQVNLQQVGQFQLSRFMNPEGLLQVGENLYAQTDASGQQLQGLPGQNGFGLIRQNALEASNTEPVRELVTLITTQRNFELNSQVVQAADQSLQVVANLRRY